jgi:site-specific recombinase XerD
MERTYDLRRLFAAELANNGLPVHIGASLFGRLNLQTTRGYLQAVGGRPSAGTAIVLAGNSVTL